MKLEASKKVQINPRDFIVGGQADALAKVVEYPLDFQAREPRKSEWIWGYKKDGKFYVVIADHFVTDQFVKDLPAQEIKVGDRVTFRNGSIEVEMVESNQVSPTR